MFFCRCEWCGASGRAPAWSERVVPPLGPWPLGKGEPSASRKWDLSLPRQLRTGFLEFAKHFLLVPRVPFQSIPPFPPLRDSLRGAHLPGTFSCVVLTSESVQAPGAVKLLPLHSLETHQARLTLVTPQAWWWSSAGSSVVNTLCSANTWLLRGWLFTSVPLGWAPSYSLTGACRGRQPSTLQS